MSSFKNGVVKYVNVPDELFLEIYEREDLSALQKVELVDDVVERLYEEQKNGKADDSCSNDLFRYISELYKDEANA